MREKDIKILWGRSGNRCAICKLELTPDGSKETLGEMAHIVARSTDGPRGNAAVTDRDDYENLILLCPTHHVEIDKDPATWPVSRLQSTKAEHESWVSEQLGAGQIRVAPIDNTAFLAQRELAWNESSRGRIAMVLGLTPLRVSGETLNTLDKSIVDVLERANVPEKSAHITQVNRFKTRPTEFGVVNEDFPNTPRSFGHAVHIFRVGHCEYFCEFGAGVDQVTKYVEGKFELAGAQKAVRYTDIAMIMEHGLTWLSVTWKAVLPFNYMTFTVALLNTNLTTLYSSGGDWETVFGFAVRAPMLKYSDVVTKEFDRPALLLESLKRMVNSYGLVLDRVHDDKQEYVRPQRMR